MCSGELIVDPFRKGRPSFLHVALVSCSGPHIGILYLPMAEVTQKWKTLPFEKDDAEKWNCDLMVAFQEALEKNPAVDLLSVVGKSYLAAYRIAQSAGLSEAGELNLETVYHLEDKVLSQPDINLRDNFPSDYDRRYRWAMAKKQERPQPTRNEAPPSKQTEQPPDWPRVKLQQITTASIIHPLSGKPQRLSRSIPRETVRLKKARLSQHP
ncbi:uncharacterized protein BJX67DRAFT_347712 [Aspergillus lucknowensis]|uniref:Uncharacterized protein n=1 Tax=Aspergillus lucknowensis TaxID=176173 RepID=A0ABR4M1Z2_9EURO